MRFNGAATLQLRKLSSYTTWRVTFSQLQWGRNFAVAETGLGGCILVCSYNASMGPQLCSCGNDAAQDEPLVEQTASMGPQLCSCGNRKNGTWSRSGWPSFNGAATLQLRKLVSAGGTAPDLRRFNGAATLQLRKLVGGAARQEYGRQSFNGAATLQLRKP